MVGPFRCEKTSTATCIGDQGIVVCPRHQALQNALNALPLQDRSDYDTVEQVWRALTTQSHKPGSNGLECIRGIQPPSRRPRNP